jgi:hypothetical protein
VTQILTNLASNLKDTLAQIDVDESIYETAFTISESKSAPLGLLEARSSGLNSKRLTLKAHPLKLHVKQSDDDAWSMLASIICSANLLINSPFPNYGILEMYGDNCAFVMIDALFERMKATTPISLLAHTNLVGFIAEFIVTICKNFREVVISNQNYWPFTVSFLQVAFLSHDHEVIHFTCTALDILAKGFVTPEELVDLRRHFVFALNVCLLSAECRPAKEFVGRFGEVDPDFVMSIGEKIQECLDSHESRVHFSAGYRLIWDRSKQASGIPEFQSIVCPMSLKLFTLPSLQEFFSFK